MAVLDTLPGVEVNIVVNKKPLKEYQDSDVEEEHRTVTRYVEAVSNQVFEIHMTIEKGFKFRGNCLTFKIYVDGNRVQYNAVDKENCARAGYNLVSDTVNLENGKLGKYNFSAIELAIDGRMFINEPHKLQDLGTLTVEVRHEIKKLHVTKKRATKSRVVEAKGKGSTVSAKVQDNIVSEKALKGQSVSHRIGFVDIPGPPMPLIKPSKKVVTHKYVDKINPVVGKFVFRYRSLNALKSMLIVPPTPPLEERDVTTLTVTELQELQRRLKAMQDKEADLVKVKREQRDVNPRPRKIHRPNADGAHLGLDDEGGFRELSTDARDHTEVEIVEID